MTEQKLIDNRKSYLEKIDTLKSDMDLAFTKDFHEFLDTNIKVKENVVYSVSGDYVKPARGSSRFVVYQLTPNFFHGELMVQASGWWLDKTDTPKKWATYTIYGVGNPCILEKHENQKHNKHPEAIK